MTEQVALALVLHNHQPVGNFGWVIAEAYERAYAPLLGALERHPAVRVALHYTGPLLDWIREERPDFLVRLHGLVEAGQVELLGGGYYEPVLAALPRRDRQAQLELMAAEVATIGGRRPQGAWLAERVWEPDLPVDLVDAGYRWTVLDDEHFRAASVDEKKLWASHTTDDQGRLLTVFGSDRGLRYRIPFGDVDETIAYLRAHAAPAGHVLGVMGDDGEKFGSWPETYEHCWGSGQWVDRFFTALEASSDWLDLVTPSEWIAREAPVGRVYLPTTSYTEMTEWALPADEGLAFEEALIAAHAAGRPEARWLRGGFWRNFQVKYREINDLHKQMLRASAKVAVLPAGPSRDRATAELLQGQSNDCYWHGVFGGIYIAHMRLATHEHLIAAEDLADAAGRADGGAVDGLVEVDTDLDGRDEILVTCPGQVVVVDPAEGAGIGTWDIRAVRHALASVLRRRPEAYHARLLAQDAPAQAGAGKETGPPLATDSAAAAEAAARTGPSAGPEPTAAAVPVTGEIPTIHSVVRSREPGLARRLHYDRHERRSGLVHLFAPGTTAQTYAAAQADELGDAHDGPYEVVGLGADTVHLRRDVVVRAAAAATTVRIDKTFTFGFDRRAPLLRLDVSVENLGAGRLDALLGVEWALMMLGGGGNPDAYYQIDGERWTHDSAGEREEIGVVISGNRYVGVELATRVEPAATAWWSPIETISNSEYGFERVYQGSSLVTLWPIRLVPGKRLTVAIRQEIATARDRSDPVLSEAWPDIRGPGIRQPVACVTTG